MAGSPEQPRSLFVGTDEALIGVIVPVNGRDMVRYFAEEETSDAVVPSDATRAALGAIGAWSDLDWDEMEIELDRIRHQSEPTPPIESL